MTWGFTPSAAAAVNNGRSPSVLLQPLLYLPSPCAGKEKKYLLWLCVFMAVQILALFSP